MKNLFYPFQLIGLFLLIACATSGCKLKWGEPCDQTFQCYSMTPPGQSAEELYCTKPLEDGRGRCLGFGTCYVKDDCLNANNPWDKQNCIGEINCIVENPQGNETERIGDCDCSGKRQGDITSFENPGDSAEGPNVQVMQ